MTKFERVQAALKREATERFFAASVALGVTRSWRSSTYRQGFPPCFARNAEAWAHHAIAARAFAVTSSSSMSNAFLVSIRRFTSAVDAAKSGRYSGCSAPRR